MKELSKKTVKRIIRPERIIQFGEGNFLRAFADWMIGEMNRLTDFNSSVVVVQPIERGMVDLLNKQDCLYHVNLQGLEKGEKVNSLTMIDVISRALNPYQDFDAYLKLAEKISRLPLIRENWFSYSITALKHLMAIKPKVLSSFPAN